MNKKILESLLKYIQDEKESHTPSNLILAGLEGRLVGMLENLELTKK